MISGNETTTKWTKDNKIYIPQEINFQNNRYTISNDEITVITDNNCYTQYQTTYCDCYRYNAKYNIVTETYACNRNPSNYIIDNSYISSDINDSYRITRDYSNYYLIFFQILMVMLLFTIVMKRNGIKI